jgi:hypothetical protein
VNKDIINCSFNSSLSQVALNQNQTRNGSDSLEPFLPTEIISKIFSSISRELATCALVSKSWKEWAYEKSFEIREEEEICDERQLAKFLLLTLDRKTKALQWPSYRRAMDFRAPAAPTFSWSIVEE